MSYDDEADDRDSDQLVLDAIGGRRPNGKGLIRANCPFCPLVVGKTDRKQCLSLNMNGGWYKCYRCETSGRVGDMPFDIETAAARKEAVEEEKEPILLPEGMVPLAFGEGKTSIMLNPARSYLARRKVSMEVVKAARIGACVRGPMQGRIVVPIYRAGKLAGYVARIWKKKGEKPYLYNRGFDRASTLYNEEALYRTSKNPVYVVEGVFDTFPFWPDAVAMLGKPSEAQIEMLLQARRPIAIVFDGDAHLEGASLAMGLRVRGKTAISLKLAPGVDPDEIPDEVRERARAALDELAA